MKYSKSNSYSMNKKFIINSKIQSLPNNLNYHININRCKFSLLTDLKINN